MKNDSLIIHLVQEFSSVKVLPWFGMVLIHIINKSTDHLLQKQTSSGQKTHRLIKMMSLVVLDGYVLDTISPYPGTKNDATRAQHITQAYEELQQWCEGKEVTVVDRGFDRVREFFQDMRLEVKMLSFLKRKQRSSEETNEARLGTKIRCGVEIHHVRLKKFTLLQNTSLLEKIDPYVKIVTAMLSTINFSIKRSK